MSASTYRSISYYRNLAKRLLREAKGISTPGDTLYARVRTLATFEDKSDQDITELARTGKFQQKHALAIIAQETGFSSWIALKKEVEREKPPTPEEPDWSRFFGRFSHGFLNFWFPSYEEAKEHLAQKGGYLFPYRHHFLICEGAAIQAVGIDAKDPDWERIGYDWSQPSCIHAWNRLKSKMVKVHQEKNRSC